MSGGPGTGKTTLAHALAGELGCPAIVRDEIKQGLVLSTPGYRSGGEDPLNRPALDAFFDVLGVLLRAGVTVVAEAAYQDRLWRRGLEPLAPLARIRVVRCETPAALAHDRILRRVAANPHRAAHGDRELLAALAAGERSLDAHVPLALDVPTLTVDTSDGYRPGLAEIAAFVL
ncbi:AAA family ATPase [Streptacidiphilus pinicola]|uniref:AAA family ATPase n=1 Tax=Streptacidiphilus pinicola TaxID=2219663 RepID=UPI001FB1F3DD|nr:AAA family ATPase [Streptacidiphilus pinicola]